MSKTNVPPLLSNWTPGPNPYSVYGILPQKKHIAIATIVGYRIVNETTVIVTQWKHEYTLGEPHKAMPKGTREKLLSGLPNLDKEPKGVPDT